MALETYLERTKFEIASITFLNEKDNLSARQREALKTLSARIVSSTMAKVGNRVKTLFDNGHIDNMTYNWLSSGQKPPRIPEFFMQTKIHKNTIVSGTERIVLLML